MDESKQPNVRPSKIAESFDLKTIRSMGGYIEIQKLLLVFILKNENDEHSDLQNIYLIPGTLVRIVSTSRKQNRVSGYLINSDGTDGSPFLSSAMDIELSI